MTKKSMKQGAINALSTVLEVGKGKRVLVITDQQKLTIGRAFEEGAKELGAETQLYSLPESRPLKSIPMDLSALIEKYRPGAKQVVFVNAFSGIGEETPMRIALIRTETETGARVGHAPGISEDMMTEGPMNIDYASVMKVAVRLMERFHGAKTAHLTSPSGTDISLQIEGRAFETDLLINCGTMGNLPAGEIWCAPVENGANGTIVTDGSIGDVGQVEKPITLEVKAGKLVALKGGTPKQMTHLEKLLAVDEMAKTIGELGIGLNPGARITGNLLEDEKAGETAHIAFGNNTEMPSGKNDSRTHRDFLFYKPTLEVTFKDGHKECFIKNGKIVN
jgi:aminopeptidase